MKNALMKSLIELGKKDKRIILISVDQFTGFDEELKGSMKEQFIFESISEANVVGMASGLAANGYIPYIINHATFNTRRCYEQILLDACLQDRPVRLIGLGGGLATAHLGPTHTSIDDISIMRSIPNMTVLVPSDANEMRYLMPQTVDWPESIYIRLAKYGKPKYGKTVDEEYISAASIGKALYLSNSEKGLKDDVLLISTGAMTPIAIELSELLERQKINVSVLHMATVKPIDADQLISRVKNANYVWTLEEHSLIGGLGSACLEILIDSTHPADLPPIHRIGLADEFIYKYGDQQSLFEEYGMMPDSIMKRILNKINIQRK